MYVTTVQSCDVPVIIDCFLRFRTARQYGYLKCCKAGVLPRGLIRQGRRCSQGFAVYVEAFSQGEFFKNICYFKIKHGSHIYFENSEHKYMMFLVHFNRRARCDLLTEVISLAL